MSSKRKNKVIDSPPTPGSEPHPFSKKAKVSSSEGSAKQQHEDTRESVHLDSNFRSSSASPSVAPSPVHLAHQTVLLIEATRALFGTVITSSATESEKIVEEKFRRLIESIRSAMENDDQSIPQALRDYLKDLWSELCREREQLSDADNSPHTESLSLAIVQKLKLYLFVNHMAGCIPSALLKFLGEAKVAAPQSIKDLPRVRTAYDDYVFTHRRRVSCFEGTRQALLEEMGYWVSKAETRIFMLFGLAGTGKSTIAQTIAERADNVRLLGASFFFSWDEAECRTAERFFTTIASQLCAHDPEFSSAMESMLMTEQGEDAITKYPLEQLETLILEPLRGLTPRKVVIVVDALDECDVDDIPTILMGLNKLVQVLPSFKVIITSRPQQHLRLLITGPECQKVLDLHDIEDKIDGDIELYLRHKLSLEHVKACLPNLGQPWAASDDEIKFLVSATGGLFVIASTVVLFILDKNSTPLDRIQLLLSVLKTDDAPLKTLNSIYTAVLRSAVPERCEDDIKDRSQMIIGAITLIQHPLTICALAKFIDIGVNEITAILGNLQPVVLLGSDDIPLTYNKSFCDYIQDPACCKDEDLYIDPRLHHTRMATHSLRLLNRCLKQNILDLGDPARFMKNNAALVKQGLMDNDLRGKIPMELRYACLYFAKHMESADAENAELAKELEQFLNERLLNWLEALSWIGKLDSAPCTLMTVQKQLKPTSSDLRQLVTDGLRFVGKFHQLIEGSALHTYHSALPLTPTKTSLYGRYKKQLTFCQVQGGRESWDELVTIAGSDGPEIVGRIVFSSDGTLFACCVEKPEDEDEEGNNGFAIHDAVAGIPLGRSRRINGGVFAITNDFSKAAVFDDGSITLYNVKGFKPVTTIKPSAPVVQLVLSPDGSRLVAGLDNGTVCFWDTEKCNQIESFDRCENHEEVAFSSDGGRIAFTSCDGVKLLDGKTGKVVADLEFPGRGSSALMFSGDGSRLVCSSKRSLRLWNSRDGCLIGTTDDIGGGRGHESKVISISNDGSRLVTGKHEQLELWSGNNLALLGTLDVLPIWSLVMHDDLIGVASYDNHYIALYDFNSQACIARLPFSEPTCLAFSPDCTRLAAASAVGYYGLWDIASLIASNTRHQTCPSVLTFSPSSSRLVSGHEDGTIRLWDTTNMAEVAPSPHKCHLNAVSALAFSIDGEEYTSGSEDGIIKFWSGKDRVPTGVLECPGKVQTMAFSSNMLAVSTEAIITLWDLKSRSTIATLNHHHATLLAFSHHHSLLVAAQGDQLTLWDTEKYEHIITFKPTYCGTKVYRMAFLPDDSQLAVQGHNDDFYLFNIHDMVSEEASESEVSLGQDISRLNLCTNWHRIPTKYSRRNDIVGRFPQQKDDVTVFDYSSSFRVCIVAEGSSMIALGCRDGYILLIKAL